MVMRSLGVALLMGICSAAAVAAGYEDYPLVEYINPGADGLKSGHAVGLSVFRPNLLGNSSFEKDTKGWTFSPWSQMEYHVITSADTGTKHLRMQRIGNSNGYAARSKSVANGTYGKSYINGAALVYGTEGDEGQVSVIIESSQINPPVEKRLRFRFPESSTWSLVEFNVAQNFTGHNNVKLTFKYTPRDAAYQRLDEVFLDVIPASEVDLPPGVPDTTTGSRDVCFADGELAEYDANMAREAVDGCPAPGVVKPMSIIESYRPYLADGRTVNCRTTRANEFHTRFLNRYLDELIERTDATERNPDAPGVQCAANMYAYWASQDAMGAISPFGDPQQGRLDRMWVMGGIGASYLINPHIRQRAISLGTDESIRAWMAKIGKQLSKEIDDDAANGVENNGQYWRAFSALPIALLNQDRKLLAKSKGVFKRAIDSIIHKDVAEKDMGFLLTELSRLSRAIGYHGFASKPLYGLALYSQAYGCDFMGNKASNRTQMARLTRKTIQGYYEPEVFTEAIKKYFDRSGVDVTPNDYRELNYLGHTLDPWISANVSDFIQQETGHTVSRTHGSDAGDDRLGGAYQRIAEGLPLLRPLDPGALAPDCPY